MPVDPPIVRRRLRRLERCLRTLQALRAGGRAAFLSDPVVQDCAERNAEIAAQSCADVALHIVSAAGRAAPETYADAVRALAEEGIVSPELAERIAAVVRLRNILVHDYIDVDHGRLFDELGWMDDAIAFAEAVERWLEAEEAKR